MLIRDFLFIFVVDMNIDDLFTIGETNLDSFKKRKGNDVEKYEHHLNFAVRFPYSDSIDENSPIIPKEIKRIESLMNEKLKYVMDCCICVDEYYIIVQARKRNKFAGVICIIDVDVFFDWTFIRLNDVYTFMSGMYSILLCTYDAVYQIQYINQEMRKDTVYYQYFNPTRFFDSANNLAYFLNRHAKKEIQLTRPTYNRFCHALKKLPCNYRLNSKNEQEYQYNKLGIVCIDGNTIEYWVDD